MTYILTIPIFNEEHNIKRLIDSLKKCFLNNDDECIKILLINDGSYDNSKALIASNIKNSKKLFLINHKKNMGYGAAIKTGINFSKKKSDYIIFIDSDLTNPINDIKKIKKHMDNKIEFIQGDRISGGLDLIPLKRRFFTFFGNKVANILMDMKLNDYTGGFRAVKISLYKNIKLLENDFSIIVEEKYKLKNKINTIAQFKTKIHLRSNDLRKTAFNYSLSLIFKYLNYSLKTFIIRKKF